MAKDEPQYTNHLIHEKSPYLLQHAHNPVNWYPWGKEAFDLAKKEDKPIFLSIGYATCHWCHVMEEESFQDPDVANALNDAFICVKVDREELPEVDRQYMEFAQSMIVGPSGWPLNLLLTPDLKPFFASTYLPKHNSKGLVGIFELTKKMSELWKGEEKERLVSQAEKITAIHEELEPDINEGLPDPELIDDTADILFKVADPIFGGLKGSPKFPLGYQANFLLRYFQKTEDARALFLVEKTLDMMHRGGIYDHVGGGFHRYSVDEHWHIPHFEKMLYDNALLAYAYLDAWKLTKRTLFKEIACEVCDYLLRDMQNPSGGFYTAEDADSEGVEGYFYTWSRDEVLSVLGDDVGLLFCDLFGIFSHGIVEGKSVLRLSMSIEEFCAISGMDEDELSDLIKKALKELFKERSRRNRPFLDDKIITAYNGWMIFALSEIGFYEHRNDYMQAALLTATFIEKNLLSDGLLYRRFREGEKKFFGDLDDYATYIKGLISLFERGQGTRWLELALELTETVETKFRSRDGAYYQVADNTEHLLFRKSHFSDGAEPSAAAILAENFLRLWQITFDEKYLERAEAIFTATSHYLEMYPLGYCYHLIALQRYYDEKKATCIICLNDSGQWKEEIISAFSEKPIGHHVLVWKRPDDMLFKPYNEGYDIASSHAKTTLYICREGVCSKPFSDIDEIEEAIKAL